MSEPVDALVLACTDCGAPARQRCTVGGKWRKEPHTARVVAALLASMPTPLIGYAEKKPTPHIVAAGKPQMALCGAEVGWVPTVQPSTQGLCGNCLLQLIKTDAAVAPVLAGLCPQCGAEETLEGGRLPAHKELVRRRHGVDRSDVDCTGKGMAPEVTS